MPVYPGALYDTGFLTPVSDTGFLMTGLFPAVSCFPPSKWNFSFRPKHCGKSGPEDGSPGAL